MSATDFWHRNATPEKVHTSFFRVYADDTARLADSGFTALDLYKKALQLSDATEWILMNDSPITWQQSGGFLSDGSIPMSGDLNMASHKIVNLATPSSGNDAVNKTYADGLSANLGKRARVRVLDDTDSDPATSGYANGDTIDGITLVTGDQVLRNATGHQARNGVWVVVASGGASRAAEFDTYDEYPGSLIAVEEGTTYEDTMWLCTSNVGGTLNTTPINFSTFSVSSAFESLTTTETDTTKRAAPDGVGGVQWVAGGGGGGVTFYDRRWVRGNAAHAKDDEFNDGSIDAAWNHVDDSGHSGYVTWAEAGDNLSILIGNSGDAAGELHALMKSYTPSIGDTIQCGFTGFGLHSNYPFFGLLMADGITYGAGAQAVFHSFWSLSAETTYGVGYNPSTWANYSTRSSTTDWQPASFSNRYVHLRMEYASSNHFKFYISPDGATSNWILIENRAVTLTPTHIGLCAGGWGTTTPFLFMVDYFRVNAP